MTDILQAGLDQLEINADSVQIEQLMRFVQLISKWNKTYNLTAIRDQSDMLRLHLLDSLTVLPCLKPDRIADIGTGAGLPGIPLAIMCPDLEFCLVDSNSKKTRFVQQAILELNLKNVQVKHSRVEQLVEEDGFSTVIMRAFSNISDILQMTRHLIKPEGILLAMKGQNPQAELAEIKQSYTLIPVSVPGVDAERCIVQIERSAIDG